MPNPIPYDEHALLLQIAGGDEGAFKQLFESYRDRLFHYLLSVTKSPAIAEELIMDVFLKLWLGRELLVNIREPEAFFHKVAYHKAMDYFKTVSRHERLQQIYIDRMEKASPKTAEDLLIEEENRRILLDAVNQLPARRKEIFKLRREEGMSYDEIARALHLSRSTVKNSLKIATRSISVFLQKHYPGKSALSCYFFGI